MKEKMCVANLFPRNMGKDILDNPNVFIKDIEWSINVQKKVTNYKLEMACMKQGNTEE